MAHNLIYNVHEMLDRAFDLLLLLLSLLFLFLFYFIEWYEKWKQKDKHAAVRQLSTQTKHKHKTYW